MRLVLLLAFLVGCPRPVPPPETPDKDGLRDAVDIVFRLYSTPGPKPRIELAEPNCFYMDTVPGFRTPWGCKGGLTGAWIKIVHTLPWSNGPLAHEMMHWHLSVVTGHPDGAHSTPGAWERYGPGDPRPGRVGLAIEALRAAGL